jgi:transcription initiation factor IIE alpha subunit
VTNAFADIDKELLENKRYFCELCNAEISRDRAMEFFDVCEACWDERQKRGAIGV